MTATRTSPAPRSLLSGGAHRALLFAFVLSGVAGLVYEALWSRYLALFVGSSAYAQALVLSVYLGGMAVGSLAISARIDQLPRAVLWYAAVETVLGLFGLAFHAIFTTVTAFTYDVVFAAVPAGSWVAPIRWFVAIAMVLPQAVILGTTFPLMAAALVRRDRARPGGGVAVAYLLNTLGAAAGVLIAGFLLVPTLGLAGTSVTAGVLNLVAAGIAWGVGRLDGAAPADGTSASPEGAPRQRRPVGPGPTQHGERLARILYPVAFLTAVASFAYEIGWIRMLSLVLGSATHSFELMLSAFILGLALGSLAMRRRADETSSPLRLLGFIQAAMGAAALVSLPAYVASFDLMAALMTALADHPNGYLWFNIGRYGLCLLVMLPATVLAGMTLPLIIGSLLRAGAGEHVIGRMYAVNTAGSVVGVCLAALFALPVLGLKGLIVAGAVIDILVGIWLLSVSSTALGRGRRPALGTATAAAATLMLVWLAVDLEPTLVASGVFRRGELAGERWEGLFYKDGRTATVSAHLGLDDGVVVLATNGKPDASLGRRWLQQERDTLPPRPVAPARDFTTQILAPAVGLAHRPRARLVANVGHGSGMTAASLLTSPTLEQLVTIEIEPVMVEGSLVFLPANRPAFADPRVRYVFDDAKTYFAYREEPFDLVFTEPSNPWVSGTASLFTREFYGRVADVMVDEGVFVQWVQLYELTDDLFMTVLAALDEVFPHYRAYLVGDADVAIAASRSPLLDPDWSLLETPAFKELTAGAVAFLPQHLEAQLLFDSNTFRAVLDRADIQANSDYMPLLDIGAERARFEQSVAQSIYSLAVSRVDVTRHLSGEVRRRYEYQTPPAYGLVGSLATERASWLQRAVTDTTRAPPEGFSSWGAELAHLRSYYRSGAALPAVDDWRGWIAGFLRAESALHWGTSGWVDTRFYDHVYDRLDRSEAPIGARAVVDLMRAYGVRNWPEVARAVDVLVPLGLDGEAMVPSPLLFELAVLARRETGQSRESVAALGAALEDGATNLRLALLRALLEE